MEINYQKTASMESAVRTVRWKIGGLSGWGWLGISVETNNYLCVCADTWAIAVSFGLERWELGAGVGRCKLSGEICEPEAFKMGVGIEEDYIAIEFGESRWLRRWRYDLWGTRESEEVIDSEEVILPILGDECVVKLEMVVREQWKAWDFLRIFRKTSQECLIGIDPIPKSGLGIEKLTEVKTITEAIIFLKNKYCGENKCQE